MVYRSAKPSLLDQSQHSSSHLPLLSTQTTDSHQSSYSQYNFIHNQRLAKERELAKALATLHCEVDCAVARLSPDALEGRIQSTEESWEIAKNELEVLNGIYLRTRRELEQRKGALAVLRSQLAVYSRRFLALKEEMNFTDRVVSDFRLAVTARTVSRLDFSEREHTRLRRKALQLSDSTAVLSKRWEEQQLAESVQQKRFSRQQALKTVIDTQRRARVKVFMLYGIQEIARKRLRENMNTIVRMFRTERPEEVIEKMEKAGERGRILQENVDFLIGRVAVLRHTSALLQLELSSLLKSPGRLPHSAVASLNSLKVRSFQLQLSSQEHKLESIALLADNSQSLLLTLLRRIRLVDTCAELIGKCEGELPIERLFLAFEKTVVTASVVIMQRRAFWKRGQRKQTSRRSLIGNAMPKRPSLVLPPVSPVLPSLSPALSPISRMSQETEEAQSDSDEDTRRQEYYKSKPEPRKRMGKVNRLMVTDRLQSVTEKRSFAKELRELDSARWRISSIARHPIFASEDLRLHTFVTSPRNTRLSHY